MVLWHPSSCLLMEVWKGLPITQFGKERESALLQGRGVLRTGQPCTVY